MQLNELKEILKEVNKSENDFDLFIESGSYVGDTIGNIKSLFKQIISIEITEKYYDYCKRKFVNNKNIEIIKGDLFRRAQIKKEGFARGIFPRSKHPALA